MPFSRYLATMRSSFCDSGSSIRNQAAMMNIHRQNNASSSGMLSGTAARRSLRHSSSRVGATRKSHLQWRDLSPILSQGQAQGRRSILSTSVTAVASMDKSQKGGREAEPSFIQGVADSKSGTVAKVVLKGGKVRLFKEGQPMVYSGAIDRVVGRPAPKAGDCVMVSDGREQVFGWGIYNPTSMFRVRMMQLETEAAAHSDCCLDMEEVIKQRLKAADELRRAMGLPSKETTVYRLCNSEGDRLSGLVVDVLGDAAVVASSAAWVESHKILITETLLSISGIERVVWRPNMAMLKEEGALPDNETVSEEATNEDTNEADEAEDIVEVVEKGIKYIANLGGQKTGFYADQRDNRAAVAELCKGKRVLDLCCYSGGFAISAALMGASAVTAVDSSAGAIELGRKNAGLNDVVVEFVKADIAAFMKEAIRDGKKWDVIVLDPPKLAPNRKAINRALNKYRRLNSDAMKMMADTGGLLLTCTCSGAMTQKSGAFLDVVKAAASMSSKQVTVLRVAGTGMDHTASPDYPEGNYLTTVLVRVT